MNQQFAKDVEEGLSKKQKSLSSKYFYDEVGDELFVKIMNSLEYYLTDAEMEIFTEQTEYLRDKLTHESHFNLVELGAGDGTKTQHLLKSIHPSAYTYVPIDISSHALADLTRSLAACLPDLMVEPKQGEYLDALSSIDKTERKSILFLGSNLGNMYDEDAGAFLIALADTMQTGDKLLLGLDQKKSKNIVLPAYNDAQGYTRDFNLNLLTRINNELGANFDLEQFEHLPEYDETTGIAKSYLVSKTDQIASIEAIGKDFRFMSGEKIHMEISRKYDDDILRKLLKGTNLEILCALTDSRKYFKDIILEKRA